MKVEIEIVGYAPKQKANLMKMIEDFVRDMPNQVSIGTARIKEVGSKKNAKQVSPKSSERKAVED